MVLHMKPTEDMIQVGIKQTSPVLLLAGEHQRSVTWISHVILLGLVGPTSGDVSGAF